MVVRWVGASPTNIGARRLINIPRCRSEPAYIDRSGYYPWIKLYSLIFL